MSSSSVVFMYPDRVRTIGKGLETVASALKVISAVLYAQMMILKATAFIGLVGGLVVERYIATIQQQVDQYAKRCHELSVDVNSAVDRYLAL
jgi:hypothetical protein